MKDGRVIPVWAVLIGAGVGAYALRRRCAKDRRGCLSRVLNRLTALCSPEPAGPVDPVDRGRSQEPVRHLPSCPVTDAFVAGFNSLRRNRIPRSLEGKVVLIAGGSGGLGLVLAEEFARHRSKIVLAARNAERLERARERLLRLGLLAEDVITLPFDATDSGQTERMAAEATHRFGRIDILVNCIGKMTVGPVENQPERAFKDAIESNYYSMLHTTLAVLPQMLARRDGSIVNIVSIGGKVAVPHLLPNSASKFAALGFSQGLHAELRSKGIRVTTVCPSTMRTGSHVNAMFTGDQEREYRWFSLAATLPLISASVKRAARKIVVATIYGQTEIAITPQAFLMARFAQVSPEGTAMLMHLANTFLLPAPVEGHDGSFVSGEDIRGRENGSPRFFGRYAGRRYSQGRA